MEAGIGKLKRGIGKQEVGSQKKIIKNKVASMHFKLLTINKN
jgi:hypothetical protein